MERGPGREACQTTTEESFAPSPPREERVGERRPLLPLHFEVHGKISNAGAYFELTGG